MSIAAPRLGLRRAAALLVLSGVAACADVPTGAPAHPPVRIHSAQAWSDYAAERRRESGDNIAIQSCDTEVEWAEPSTNDPTQCSGGGGGGSGGGGTGGTSLYNADTSWDTQQEFLVDDTYIPTVQEEADSLRRGRTIFSTTTRTSRVARAGTRYRAPGASTAGTT